MHPDEDAILAVAEIVRDSAAMGDAALACDFDEVRFRGELIAGKADAGGYVDLVLAAAHLLTVLGPFRTTPSPGYGAGILRIASELDRIGFTPL
jgi:hypothetical protein